jgi:tetratricopeptide (TPR) repeat protein
MSKASVPQLLDLAQRLPPKNYRNLIGREKEFNQICADINTARHTKTDTRFLIYGTSGVGKTSLALAVAYYFASKNIQLSKRECFDEIIWISAQPTILTADGFTDIAFPHRTLQEIITVIAISLDKEEILKALPENQVPLVLKALSEYSCLLIIDNVETIVDTKVFGFIEQLPSSTVVLLTSRFERDIGRSMRLQPLSQEDAIMLGEEMSRAKNISLSRSQLENLARATGRLPFGMVLAISLIRTGYNADEIISSLDLFFEDALLKFLFDKAWEKVHGQTPEDVIEVLTFFPDGATQEVVSSILKITQKSNAIDHDIVVLENLSLIDRTNGKLSILPFTRAYFTARLAEQPDKETRLKAAWVEYFADFVRNSLRESLTWKDYFLKIDAERNNIFELFNWASARTNELVYHRAAVIFYDLIYYLFSRGYWSLLLLNRQWVSDSLISQGLIEEYIVVALSWTIRIQIMQKSLENISELFSEVEEVISKSGEDSMLLPALISFNRASILRREGKDSEAIDNLNSALSVFKDLGYKQWEAEAYNRLGNTFAKQKRYLEAELAYQEVSRIASGEKLQPWTHEMLGQSAGNLGILANRLSKHQQAVELLMQCEKYIAQSSDISVVYMEFAIAYYHLKKFDKALAYADQAQNLASTLGLKPPISESDEVWEINVLPRLRSTRFLGLRSALSQILPDKIASRFGV